VTLYKVSCINVRVNPSELSFDTPSFALSHFTNRWEQSHVKDYCKGKGLCLKVSQLEILPEYSSWGFASLIWIPGRIGSSSFLLQIDIGQMAMKIRKCPRISCLYVVLFGISHTWMEMLLRFSFIFSYFGY